MKLGFSHILTLIFVVAKLTDHIDWSWWLVFLPMILGLGLTFVNSIIETMEKWNSKHNH